MPRDIAQGKMPSVTVIDIKKKPPGGAPDTSGADDAAGTESSFKCPECGADLTVESKPQQEPSGDGAMPDAGGAPPPRGGYGA